MNTCVADGFGVLLLLILYLVLKDSAGMQITYTAEGDVHSVTNESTSCLNGLDVLIYKYPEACDVQMCALHLSVFETPNSLPWHNISFIIPYLSVIVSQSYAYEILVHIIKP